jgi:copper chaperone NosL
MFLIVSCEVKPETIAFGKDACHYCKMNIVVKNHAAQFVTKKGKQFKYDAAECLLNDLNQNDIDGAAFLLVSDFNTPEKLIDATKATFLISDSVQSPMGENLATFEEKSQAISFAKAKNNGRIYSWKEIRQHFNAK